MPWKVSTTMSLKKDFIDKVRKRNQSFTSVCQEFGISRTLGYEILKQFELEGIKGLEPKSKAPHFSPQKTSSIIEDKIIEVRLKNPTWGARKIRAYLLKQQVMELPSPSTICAILKRNGYISEEESLKRQALSRFERETPNELWQMDFKGHFQMGIKKSCYPLTILDDHSRFSLCLHACENEAAFAVKKQLISVFEQYGMPLQINVDNGRPWGNSCLVKYTQISVWLMQLDILVTHSRPRHPQTNGKNERFHRTLKEDLLNRNRIENFSHAQKLFDQWRHIYNYERPHQALDMRVPADRYKPSARIMPSKLPITEYEQSAIVRKTTDTGHISYKNKDYLAGKAFTGHYIEVRPNELRGLLELYFGKHKIYTYELK